MKAIRIRYIFSVTPATTTIPSKKPLCQWLKSDGHPKLHFVFNFPSQRHSPIKDKGNKVNCIHAFFEKELKTEIENCEDYKISVEVLKKLQETIQLVLNDNLLASTHLPTQQGFFFGSQDYEWYFDDLKWTLGCLDTLLTTYKNEDTFIYHAWW